MTVQHAGLGPDMATLLTQYGGDVGALRPHREDGATYIYLGSGPSMRRVLLPGGSGVLTRPEWEALDAGVADAVWGSHQNPGAWEDLKSLSTPYQITGQSPLLVQGVQSGEVPHTVYDIPALIHGFTVDLREIAQSRAGAGPLFLAGVAEQPTRAVLSVLEGLTLGVREFKGPNGRLCGYTNTPERSVVGITIPTESGFRSRLVSELNAAIDSLHRDRYGVPYAAPIVVYLGSGWWPWFNTGKPPEVCDDRPLGVEDHPDCDRIRRSQILTYPVTVQLPGVTRDRGHNRWSASVLPQLPGHQALVVRMESGITRAVIGQEPIVIQASSAVGLRLSLKVVASAAPQIRHNLNGPGIVHLMPSGESNDH